MKILLAILAFILAVPAQSQILDLILFKQPTGGTHQASTPTFSPAAGSYSSAQTVTISTATSLAVLCYTTDGTTPTETANLCSGGTTSTYTTPITVSTTQTVKAIATLATYTDSAVGSAAYTICTPPAGATYDYDVANALNYCTSGTTACSNGLGIFHLVDSIAGNTAVQATGANQPIYTTGAINGLPAAVFTGSSSQALLMTTATPASNAYFSAYYVFELPSLSYTIGAPTGRYYQWMIFNGGGSCSSGELRYVNAGACSSTFISANTWYAVGVQWQVSTGLYSFHKYAGGSDVSEGSGTGNTSAPIGTIFDRIGGSSDTSFTTSSIARVIYYNSTLPAGLATYTGCKYGL